MNDRKSCQGCAHYRKIIGIECGCNFYFDTGELRGCPAEKCDRKEVDAGKLREYRDKAKEEFGMP